jgi:FdhD protein
VRPAVSHVSHNAWRADAITRGERAIAEETAVSFTYNGGSHAVMMATPRNLEDFAYGFSLTEGVVSSPDEIERLEIIDEPAGVELRACLVPSRAQSHGERRRYMAGPTGCGLCGIDSLAEAMRPAPPVGDGGRFTSAEVMRAIDSVAPRQELNLQTRAVHAAALWEPGAGLVALREDVGRHNALDKLVGALVRARRAADAGMVVLTSRVSVEMVQKTAVIGAPVIVAVSAPTALAVRTAETAGITLVAIARGDGFEVFTHPHRIEREAAAHVA